MHALSYIKPRSVCHVSTGATTVAQPVLAAVGDAGPLIPGSGGPLGDALAAIAIHAGTQATAFMSSVD